MHLLFHIVHAGHARGTHDKLALDALRHLECADSGRWRRLFLAHSGLYLEGARVTDEESGGADLRGGPPEQAPSWYIHVVEALGLEDWPTAAYCAGVLSRTVMDPLRPFHTAPSTAGLQPAARGIIAERMRFAYLVFAGVLGRAIEDSRALAPEVGLGAATLLAAVQAPGRMLARYRADAEKRRATERAYREFRAADTVETRPPMDDRGAPRRLRVLPFRPRERVAQAGQMREARRQARMPGSADIIALRRPASTPASAMVPSVAAGTTNVTRQPMLFLVPSDAGTRAQTTCTDADFQSRAQRQGV